jgi:hypothetical protein
MASTEALAPYDPASSRRTSGATQSAATESAATSLGERRRERAETRAAKTSTAAATEALTTALSESQGAEGMPVAPAIASSPVPTRAIARQSSSSRSGRARAVQPRRAACSQERRSSGAAHRVDRDGHRGREEQRREEGGGPGWAGRSAVGREPRRGGGEQPRGGGERDPPGGEDPRAAHRGGGAAVGEEVDVPEGSAGGGVEGGEGDGRGVLAERPVAEEREQQHREGAAEVRRAVVDRGRDGDAHGGPERRAGERGGERRGEHRDGDAAVEEAEPEHGARQRGERRRLRRAAEGEREREGGAGRSREVQVVEEPVAPYARDRGRGEERPEGECDELERTAGAVEEPGADGVGRRPRGHPVGFEDGEAGDGQYRREQGMEHPRRAIEGGERAGERGDHGSSWATSR